MFLESMLYGADRVLFKRCSSSCYEFLGCLPGLHFVRATGLKKVDCFGFLPQCRESLSCTEHDAMNCCVVIVVPPTAIGRRKHSFLSSFLSSRHLVLSFTLARPPFSRPRMMLLASLAFLFGSSVAQSFLRALFVLEPGRFPSNATVRP